jgi:hypothetical protein
MEKLKGALQMMGCHPHLPAFTLPGQVNPGRGHLATMRFASATIRKTYALDVNSKAHDLDNPDVVAAINPSLTIISNTLRGGDHLKAWLGSA